MPKKIALLFAGQGAQCVGMGRDLAEHFPVAADLFGQADEILGRSLSNIAWNGPIEELTKTSNCQPALYVHALAVLAVLREIAGDFPVASAAGLSLGEITAHAAGGTFDFGTGLELVQRRAEFMDEACAATLGGMAAMIGGLENDVRRLAADEDVDIANVNAPDQIVMMLNVAGAYHSRLMESAYEKLGAVLQDVPVESPRFPVISNVTGMEVTTPAEIRRTLQDQVTGTVRWFDCVKRLIDLGCNYFIELGPGSVLAALLRRARKEVDVISVGAVESVRECAARM